MNLLAPAIMTAATVLSQVPLPKDNVDGPWLLAPKQNKSDTFQSNPSQSSQAPKAGVLTPSPDPAFTPGPGQKLQNSMQKLGDLIDYKVDNRGPQELIGL